MVLHGKYNLQIQSQLPFYLLVTTYLKKKQNNPINNGDKTNKMLSNKFIQGDEQPVHWKGTYL